MSILILSIEYTHFFYSLYPIFLLGISDFDVLPVYFVNAVCRQVFVGTAEVLVAEETVVCR